jgi:hypothetical protein
MRQHPPRPRPRAAVRARGELFPCPVFVFAKVAHGPVVRLQVDQPGSDPGQALSGPWTITGRDPIQHGSEVPRRFASVRHELCVSVGFKAIVQFHQN